MIETVAQTGSTNADLLERLRTGDISSENYWLVAERQTAGRGRMGRTWFDGHGNFMGSTLVHLGADDPAPSTLALVMGVAVFDTVRAIAPNLRGLSLKWPNDLLIGAAKLAGILLERHDAYVVVGFGVNLCVAPAVDGRTVTALAVYGPVPDRDAFAILLAQQVQRGLHRWRTEGLPPLIERWSARAHAVGTPLRLVGPGEEPIVGAFAGLARDGALRLQLAGGAERVIHAGDVTLVSGKD